MASDSYSVTLLREGSEEVLPDGNIKRRCNTVLVSGPSGHMIVNPGSAWDGPDLIESLKKHGIDSPSKIKYVVCTDGRAAHVGCLNLFVDAEMMIVGHDIQKGQDVFVEHSFSDATVPFEIDEHLSVVGTPGTMDQQVTVLVKGLITPHASMSDPAPSEPSCVAITGSIFADAADASKTGFFDAHSMKPDFMGDKESYLSVWRRSRDRLLAIADWIFPAFGRPFKVKPEFSNTPCVELA
uniref:Metallo-beta-lactamase domain-containing protein 1 n=1 Tax=Schistocephalus solidus TaxID=70667 RepID=A0A0V0J731_SCHSO